jgi:2-furoate---CoA ligase
MDLATAFALTVARRPGAFAITDGGKTRTYAQWHAESLSVAGGLVRLGLTQGDRLLVLLRNRYETTVLYWACQSLGVVFTPLNWRARTAEVAFCLDDSAAKAVAFEDVSIDSVCEALAQCGRDGVPRIVVGAGRSEAGETSYTDLTESDPPRKPVVIDEHSTCLMLYTSGTTGRPKGVPRTHRNELSAAVSQIAHNRYLFGESALGVMPLYHTMGIRVLLSTALLNGKFVCVPTYDTEQVLGLIESELVTTMFLVPTLYFDILRHPRRRGFNLSSLARIGYAGMTMTTALSEECLAELRPELFVNYYGSSEVYTLSFCDHLDIKPGCAGRPGLHQTLRIVRADPDSSATPDDFVPRGETGEIIASLSSPEAFGGYWQRPDATAKALRGGWYFTGDLGHFDEDGELYVAGRVDDMVITGGENVYPEEVENVLARAPSVGRVAVVGMPDDRWGQKLVAFVELAQGQQSENALNAHCRAAGLAGFKCPKEYVFVERIPQSPVGKLLRRELRAGNYRRVG